ncbi:hypothetical protein KGF45_17620 [Clostridioides sp. ZZV14-6154]|uniref:hypothetical protein n=2 Tax=Clostridioides TaxID=1870884 RepID=UPI001D1245DB|nr:hypothetical protein [Clostridioides sp. ZZV14-6154]MCC0670171.1 hypothetical protein [Clostridioides sp. ZZV14-6153]
MFIVLDLLLKFYQLILTFMYIFISKEFKLYAVRENLEKTRFTKDIFLEACIDLKIIGFDKPKDCLRKWRKIYLKQG